MQKIANKTAIVTGAGSGMGKAIAELFAKEEARTMRFGTGYWPLI
jgi:NAD(P)-dependent dehydrogenase (short-subunit alcohol dehydrogenase family)